MKIILGLAIFFVIATIIVAGIYFLILPHPSLLVVDQPVDEGFTISEAVLTRPGFILVVEATSLGKPSGVAASKQVYLSAGTYQGVRLIKTTPSDYKKSLYFAIILEDSDKNTWLSRGDSLAKDALGRDIIVAFSAR